MNGTSMLTIGAGVLGTLGVLALITAIIWLCWQHRKCRDQDTDEHPVDTEALANKVAEALASMREAFAPMDEAALGYRTQLEAAGWSPTIAEQMAAQFYTFTMATFMKGMSTDGS